MRTAVARMRRGEGVEYFAGGFPVAQGADPAALFRIGGHDPNQRVGVDFDPIVLDRLFRNDDGNGARWF